MVSFRIIPFVLPLLVSFAVVQESQTAYAGKLAKSRLQIVQISSVGKPTPGEYTRTHGQNVVGVYAPYVEEYAKINGIDMVRVSNALFPKGFPKPLDQESAIVFISSYQYRTADWSYIKSVSIMFYELLKIRIGNSLEPMLIVLYNRSTPDKIIIDRFDAKWHLAILDEEYKVLTDCSFTTHIKYHEEGLWDMIYTDLAIKSGKPIVKIMYAHTGGGGGRDQEFTFWFATGNKPIRLKLLKAQQTIDEYNKHETED